MNDVGRYGVIENSKLTNIWTIIGLMTKQLLSVIFIRDLAYIVTLDSLPKYLKPYHVKTSRNVLFDVSAETKSIDVQKVSLHLRTTLCFACYKSSLYI